MALNGFSTHRGQFEMVEIAEVFLPYMMVSKTKTLYAYMVSNDMRLMEADVDDG